MSDNQHRTFQGKSVQEAISKVKAALGDNACIIEKRVRKNKNFFKLGGGEEIVEIIASAAPSVVNEVTPRYKPNASKQNTNNQSPSLLEQAYGSHAPTNRPKTPFEMYKEASQPAHVSRQSNHQVGQDNSGYSEDIAPTQREPHTQHAQPVSSDSAVTQLMAQMRSEILRLTSIQARGAIPEVGEALLDSYQSLIENEVNANTARTIVEKLQRDMPFTILDRENINEHVAGEIAKYIHTSGPSCMSKTNNRPTVIAIIGPNGSGKTTTLTKIAFEAVVKQNKTVGLITEDIKRPGAEAQLRSLTSIMQLPLVSVSSASNMADEIHNMSEKDVILIDTGGVSHNDEAGIAELREMLRVASVDEIHLQLPVSITERTALAIIEGYKPLNYNRIIFSKIDASASFGMILNIANKINIDISYVTSGSNCSQGLYPAVREDLSRLITESNTSAVVDGYNNRQ